MKSRRKFVVLGVLLSLALLSWLGRGFIEDYFLRPTGSSLEKGLTNQDNFKDIEVVAQDLTVPWGVAFLPDGDLLVTERSGTLRRLGQDKQTHVIAGVEHIGEGGLLGVALDPDFKANNRLYLYMTTRSGEALTNRIERYVYKDGKLSDRQIMACKTVALSCHKCYNY